MAKKKVARPKSVSKTPPKDLAASKADQSNDPQPPDFVSQVISQASLGYRIPEANFESVIADAIEAARLLRTSQQRLSSLRNHFPLGDIGARDQEDWTAYDSLRMAAKHARKAKNLISEVLEELLDCTAHALVPVIKERAAQERRSRFTPLASPVEMKAVRHAS